MTVFLGQYTGKSKPLPEYHVKIASFGERVGLFPVAAAFIDILGYRLCRCNYNYTFIAVDIEVNTETITTDNSWR